MRSPFLRSIRRVLRSIASKGNPPPGDREILAHLPLHPPPSTAYTFGRLAVQLLLCQCLSRQRPALFTSLGAEEAVKHALNVVDMSFFDVSASKLGMIHIPFRRPLVGDVPFFTASALSVERGDVAGWDGAADIGRAK